ncbi:MAG: YbaN family protein [Acinetobacter sp.]
MMKTPDHPELNESALDSEDTKLAKSVVLRWLFIGLACLCIALGTIGIFIPGLPTVDFYILAAFFSAKGSKRLHSWFIHHRWVGPILRQWHDYKTIPKKVKIMSLIGMSFAAIVMLLTIPHFWFVMAMIVCMLLVQVWMWTRA